jgi:predicted amidohydrolase
MSQTVRVAAVQMDIRRLDTPHNRTRIAEYMRVVAQAGVQLVIFPECALSGYVFQSKEEALPASEPLPGESSTYLASLCKELGLYAIVGLLEREGDTLYNSAMVLSPEGLITTYRKCHLPILGVDRYVGLGNNLEVIELPLARIGILICYDVRFSEACRSLALQGADILVLPTNWPQGAESSPDFLTRARAWENRIFLIACNRVGVEEGVRFIGRSQIITPAGTVLLEALGDKEEVLIADIEPSQAREKRIVMEPGVFEFDPIGGRRPELYGKLTEQHKER